MVSAHLSVMLRISGAAAFSVTLRSHDALLTAVQFCPAVFSLPDFQGAPSERDVLEKAAHSLQAYCSGHIPAPQARRAPLGGTRGACLDALTSVPRGAVVTYADLALQAGLTRLHARAVGSYCAGNPWPLFIPCHRVIPAHGSKDRPGNYAGGAALKMALLQLDDRPMDAEG